MPVASNTSDSSTASFITFFILSPAELLRSVTFVSDLLQFVEQSLVADLQLPRGPPPVPARARQHLEDQLFLGFMRCRPRSCLQRNSLTIAGCPRGAEQSA